MSYFTGTRLWDRLSEEQRFELNRQEAGSLLIAAVFFEAALGVFLYHDLLHTKIHDNKARYLLTEIGEEARHSTMFSRLVAKMNEGGGRPVESWVPKAYLTLLPFLTSLVPPSPMLYAALLMSEEVFDQV